MRQARFVSLLDCPYNVSMATGASARLVGRTSKQKAEAANFEAFKLAHPNFAARPLVSIQWGGDPPDVLCLDATGYRIGVEMVQWINERQIAASKPRYRVEASYRLAIRSIEVQPPKNIGMVFISLKDKTLYSSRAACDCRFHKPRPHPP